MDFYEVIKTRQSIRSYDPSRPVDDSTLNRILDAGRLAPSAANRQPWHFLVFKSLDMLNQVRGCYNQSWFHDAPCVFAIVGDYNEAWTRKYDNYNPLETDLAIAMDHIILAATNEGLGTCWIAAFNPAILRKALNLKDNEKVYTITPLGYPKSDLVRSELKSRKTLQEIVKIL